jgi:hypothetical protein
VLRAFLSAKRDAILARSREKVRARPAPPATEDELEKGIPLLLDQLTDAFRDPDGQPVARETEPGRELTELGVEQRGMNRTGLGLSISRRSVEADGGTLAVQDIPGTGCVFMVELPRLSAAT